MGVDDDEDEGDENEDEDDEDDDDEEDERVVDVESSLPLEAVSVEVDPGEVDVMVVASFPLEEEDMVFEVGEVAEFAPVVEEEDIDSESVLVVLVSRDEEDELDSMNEVDEDEGELDDSELLSDVEEESDEEEEEEEEDEGDDVEEEDDESVLLLLLLVFGVEDVDAEEESDDDDDEPEEGESISRGRSGGSGMAGGGFAPSRGGVGGRTAAGQQGTVCVCLGPAQGEETSVACCCCKGPAQRSLVPLRLAPTSVRNSRTRQRTRAMKGRRSAG